MSWTPRSTTKACSSTWSWTPWARRAFANGECRREFLASARTPTSDLDGLREVASQFEGGAIDCSIGTPIDPPPDFVIEELARGVGARGYPPSAGTADFRDAAAGWVARRFGVDVPTNDLAACVGTKEFVASLAGYLHLRSPERDTVLYPAISYPTYAMGATLAGLRAVPVAMVKGQLDLSSIEPNDAERAAVLWANSPANPSGYLDDLERVAQWGRSQRRTHRQRRVLLRIHVGLAAANDPRIRPGRRSRRSLDLQAVQSGRRACGFLRRRH